MATYVVSDIHGEYNMFMKMLDKIGFSDSDTMYFLGDAVDRGPNPIKVLLELVSHYNIIPILGNHEYMMVSCLKILEQYVTDEMLANMLTQNDTESIEKLANWLGNGSISTIEEYRRLGPEQRDMIKDYLGEFSLFETASA